MKLKDDTDLLPVGFVADLELPDLSLGLGQPGLELLTLGRGHEVGAREQRRVERASAQVTAVISG